MSLEKWEVSNLSRVAFYTLGCKVNHYETEAMQDQFKRSGYDIVDFQEKADIYIIHSCTVTNLAAAKSRKYARRAKRHNPQATVVMIGCYPQVFPDEIKNIDEVDYILGTEGKNNVVDFIEKARMGKYTQTIKNRSELTDYEDIRIYNLEETTRAYIKIQEGCNQFCSYCIIPYARGPQRSRSEDSILTEVEELTAKGVPEIVLTGIHLGAYGLDLQNGESLDRLLKKLLVLKNDFRIRLSSIEVTEISENLIELMSSNKRFCHHLHIPLQSGSDKILETMKRPYNTDKYENTISLIREKIPDIGISTDIMVGFPGESDADFMQSYKFVEDINFSRLHVFPYSRREGTPAARMKNQVHGNKKKERSQLLHNLNKKLMQNFQKRFLNTDREVIIEEKREQKTGLLTGYTGNYIRVLIDDSDEHMAHKRTVRLINSYDYESAIGEIIA